MNHSKFKELLLKSVPNNFFEIIKYQTRITSDKNLELLKKENDLKTRYRNLNKTKILYNGEEKTIGFISGLFSAKNRSTRKKAHDAINDFYYQYDFMNKYNIKDLFKKVLSILDPSYFH